MKTDIISSKFLPGNGLVDGVLDEIIPAGVNNQIPSAGSLEISNYLENICSKDSDTATILRRGFALAERLVAEVGPDFSALEKGQRVTIVKRLETDDVDFFTALLRHTYMGYYSRGDVRKSLGLSEFPVQPQGYDVTEESSDLMETLTASVRERGDCYRT